MTPKLSILIPIENCQSVLRQRIQDCLEVAAEMTDEFEIVVVDDGSSDDSHDLAYELAVRYRQVFAYAHREHRGRGAALQTAIERSTGTTLLIMDPGCDIPLDDMPRLWRHAEKHQVVLGYKADDVLAGPAPAGMQIVDRWVIDVLCPQLTCRQQLIQAMVREGISWHEEHIGQGATDGQAMLENRADAIARQILEGPSRKRLEPKSPNRERETAGGPKFIRLSETSRHSAE